MNSICGIVNWNREPVDTGDLQRMSEACWRPAEGREYWTEDFTGMASAAWHTTPESLSERQPLIGEDGRFIVVADVRLDHRGELIHALKDHFPATSKSTDVELILLAYLKWGDLCGQYLLGDYAFAIWDSSEHRMLCARDAFGSKQLYYFADRERMLFASTISQLLAHPVVNAQIDDLAIAYYFTQRPPRYLTEHTYYRGICRVLPAHAMAISPDSPIRKIRFWDIERDRKLEYSDPRQYAEEFRHLLANSVASCSRSSTPLAVTASGGMDSTSVAVLLARQQNAPFRLYSIAYGEGHAADESAYVRELASHCQAELVFIEGMDYLPYSSNPLAEYRYDEPPPYWDDAVWHALFGTAARDGCRVVTVGACGDGLFLVQPYVFGDYLRRGRVGFAVREFRSWQKRRGEEVPLAAIKAMLKPLLPQKSLGCWHRRMPGGSDWLSAQFMNRCRHTPDWTARPPLFDTQGFTSWHQSTRYAFLTDLGYPFRESMHRLALHHGLEARDPFQDRKLIEFALAIPPEQCLYRGERKRVLRKAMSGILPETINKREDKTRFDSVARTSIKSWVEEGDFKPASEWASCRHGYVDCKYLQTALDQCTAQSNRPLARGLGKMVQFDRWLVQVQGSLQRGKGK